MLRADGVTNLSRGWCLGGPSYGTLSRTAVEALALLVFRSPRQHFGGEGRLCLKRYGLGPRTEHAV